MTTWTKVWTTKFACIQSLAILEETLCTMNDGSIFLYFYMFVSNAIPSLKQQIVAPLGRIKPRC
jgi:hypothetical protein